MYVKLFSQILDSSIASNRSLRHFFTDLLLLCDPDGNIVMTKEAIAHRIRADLKEVEWGLKELMKPDKESNHPDLDGRRIVPLEGHGYGWQIVNYRKYRAMKSAAEFREDTRIRVQKFRERRAKKQNRQLRGAKGRAPTEAAYLAAERAGATPAQLDAITDPT